MSKARFVTTVMTVVGFAAACGGAPMASEDERSAVGDGNPASTYCVDLGYTLKSTKEADGERSVCEFPDGTTCEEWAFFRGKCGQAFSYCNKNGGTVSNRETPTMSYGVCTTKDGKACSEVDFFKTGKCEPLPADMQGDAVVLPTGFAVR